MVYRLVSRGWVPLLLCTLGAPGCVGLNGAFSDTDGRAGGSSGGLSSTDTVTASGVDATGSDSASDSKGTTDTSGVDSIGTTDKTTEDGETEGLDDSGGLSTGTTDGESGGADSGVTPGPCNYVVQECDLTEPDCPDGEVCRPYVDDAGDFRSGCFAAGGAGEWDACMLECDAGGYDDCGPGLACDPFADGDYVCYPLCGSNDQCELPAACADFEVADGFVISLCVDEGPECEVFSDDCPDGLNCVPSDEGGICVPPGKGAAGGPCADDVDCEPGTFCDDEGSPACSSGQCCAALCEVDEPGCNCVPLDGPPGLDGVGVCAAPMEPKP
ncbi:MAG: hypothetical protein AAGA54_16165 [Myxococcota bacterium]